MLAFWNVILGKNESDVSGKWDYGRLQVKDTLLFGAGGGVCDFPSPWVRLDSVTCLIVNDAAL